MIFRPELARKIARGEKTQTRRPVKPGEKHCRYREGRDYAVQPGRGKPSGGPWRPGGPGVGGWGGWLRRAA